MDITGGGKDAGVALAAGLLVAWALTPAVSRLARAAGAIDVPEARRVNREATPRLAGLALYVAWWVALLVGRGQALPGLFGFGLGTGALVVVGAIDDVWDASAVLRFVVQTVAAELAWMAGFHFPLEGTPLAQWVPLMSVHALAHGLTLLWIVGITNAVNFMDGLDFLASGIALIATAALLVFAYASGGPTVVYMAMIGSIIGVGIYNRFPARIFLGDCGSTFLGYFVACMACKEAHALGAATLAPFVPPVLLAVPLLDTTYAVVRRLYRGVSPFSPDRGHIHHRLLASGLTQVQAVRRIMALCLTLAVLAFIVAHAPILPGSIALALALGTMLIVARRLSLFAPAVMACAGIDGPANPTAEESRDSLGSTSHRG